MSTAPARDEVASREQERRELGRAYGVLMLAGAPDDPAAVSEWCHGLPPDAHAVLAITLDTWGVPDGLHLPPAERMKWLADYLASEEGYSWVPVAREARDKFEVAMRQAQEGVVVDFEALFHRGDAS